MLTTNASLMDGINRHILSIAGALNRSESCEVAVCTVMPSGDLNESLKNAGVKVYSLGYHNGHAFGVMRAFSKVVKDFRPDIIHSHVLAIMERIYISYFGRGIKFIETIHGIGDTKERISLRDRVENLLLRLSPIKVAARCFVSEGVRDALHDSLGATEVSEVSYNPIEFDKAPLRSFRLHDVLALSHSSQIIGTACRISSVKNPKAFTEIMCRVLSDIPETHAVVIGDGDCHIIAECKRLVESYGVADRFHWMGYRVDAPELISGMSCFVMTSLSEGLPTSVLECFIARTPVAMLHGGGGLKDIVNLSMSQKPIVLHAPSDAGDVLAKMIVRLLQDDSAATELATNAFEIGASTFSLSAVAEQLQEIYKRVIG